MATPRPKRAAAARFLILGAVLWVSSLGSLVAVSSASSGHSPAVPTGASRNALAAQTSESARPSSGPTDPGPDAPPATATPPDSTAAAPRSFVVLGDSLSAWTFAPGSAIHTTSGVWPSLLAAQDPGLILANNAGIPANNTGQMLARLRRDVLDYDPDLLFLLGGTNDVGQDVPNSTALANIRQIVETAQGHGITVILLTIPPANGDYAYRAQARQELNAALADLADQEGILLVDTYAALSSWDGHLAPEYAACDGLHLSQHGEQALADAVYRALHPPAGPLPS